MNPQYMQSDVQHWIELHGIRLREHGGGVFAYIPTPCSALTPEGMCGLQGQPERPELCAAFPSGQWQLDELLFMGVDSCTYSFPEAPVGHGGVAERDMEKETQNVR